MVPKHPRPPMTQRRFFNDWGELAYLCKKIRYWFYSRMQKTRAERYLNRLERVLHNLPENGSAIIRQEGLALLHELRGEIGKSVMHRQREIELIERLHKEAQSHDDSTRAHMLQDRDVAALHERRAILEALRKTKALQSHPAMPRSR